MTGPSNLAKAFAGIEGAPRYLHADWGYEVLDQRSGKVLAAQTPQKMFDPGLDHEDVLGLDCVE